MVFMFILVWYTWKLSLGKNPVNLILQKIWWNKLPQCHKGHYILYAIINREQKISVIKFSPMIAGGIWQIFSPGEISMYGMWNPKYTLGEECILACNSTHPIARCDLI
jgi:hypothetical protein